MWEMMMTQEDDDLEEELRCLDIREDHGAEDSDVTPTNTPPSTPPILYIKKYPPNKPNFDEHKEFGRYSRSEDFDSRTDSSLSWGDDEFEGEATRQVGILFDQLDFLLYKEKVPPSPIPCSSDSSDTYRFPYVRADSNTSITPSDDVEISISSNDIQDMKIITDAARITQVNQKESFFDVEDLGSAEILYNSSRLLKSSPRFSLVSTHNPSPELQEECSSWVQQFPHFRARGHSLDFQLLNILEKYLAQGGFSQENNEESEEEVIAYDGDFTHLLPSVTFTSANQAKHSRSDDQKRETSSSRVCSGSNDPEVLKEQILIMLFDKLWLSVTDIIEPLLHQYAKYVIEQSVQYSSLSREPSTRGSRIECHTPIRKVSEELVKPNAKLPKATYSLFRPTSSESTRNCEMDRQSNGLRRPCSAFNRLKNVDFTAEIHQEELQDLLQVSSKPLQNCEDRLRSRTSSASVTRESSAKSHLSQISLPSLATPRTPVRRPVSSKTANHLLTPMRVESVINHGEQRPASTSSYNSRVRFQEKFQHLSRQGTIQESQGDNIDLDIDEDALEVPNPAWSRHISFLPPITDSSETLHRIHGGQQIVRHSATPRRRDSSAEIPLNIVQDDQQPQSPIMTGEDLQLSTLSIRGTMVSAAQRPHAHIRSKKHVWGTPITEGGRSQKLICPHQK